MIYPGGKNLAGTYQRIINQIPPHKFYCEPFAGSAAIARLKEPSAETLLIDRDPGAIAGLAGMVPQGTRIMHGCGLKWLKENCRYLDRFAVVYCDPPYLPSVCSSPLRYKYKLTAEQHAELVDHLRRCRCRILISGYWSGLYAKLLGDWRMIHWPQITRGGHCQEECLWMNYPEPMELHDYRYLGENYRERENLARMKKRWTARIRNMPRLKRLAMMAAIAEADAPGAIGVSAGIAGLADSARVTSSGRDRSKHR